MVWEVSHDYIEGTGNPILDSIAIALRSDSTTAIKPLRPRGTHNADMCATGRNGNASGCKTRATDLKGRNVPSKAAHGAYYKVKAK